MESNGKNWLISRRAGSSDGLARKIFQAELPEETVRSLPAESLYFVMKHNGLGSSGDLIAMTTLTQCRLMLDLDCWRGDAFNEDNLFEWLEMADQDNSLQLLHKLLACIDLKLISLLISRYVDIFIQEDTTELPPAPRYYTPDNGHTWILIQVDDESKHFLLGRLLALIFETDAELFYQLIAIPNVATPSVLEEEALQDRNRRLSAEGIPDREYAAELHIPLPAHHYRHPAGEAKPDMPAAIVPLLYDSDFLEPLSSLLQRSGDLPEMEAELSLILNAAIVHWLNEFDRSQDILSLAAKVKGALNIGLESAMQQSGRSALEIYEADGLQVLYRFGLDLLFQLRSQARRSLKGTTVGADPATLAILEYAAQPFPEMPAFIKPDGSFETQEGKLLEGQKAIERVAEIQLLQRLI